MAQLDTLKQILQEQIPTLELRERELMAKHTTFRVGGPATLMALPKTMQQAQVAVEAATQLGITPVYLGNGSNLLVADNGIDAFVMKTTEGLQQLTCEGERITGGSGISLAHLAGFALKYGLTGLEFAHGIPGSLGGAVTMNAGAYGGEMSQVVEQVIYLDSMGKIHKLEKEDCAFAYRRSIFEAGDCLILSVVLRLQIGDFEQIKMTMDDLMKKRREKQPLEYPSAGSTFKRPNGYFAAALIDQCGLKGLRVGDAQVSEKHAGFIINRGNATCANILELMDRVKSTVLDQTGVMLEPEVRIMGV